MTPSIISTFPIKYYWTLSGADIAGEMTTPRRGKDKIQTHRKLSQRYRARERERERRKEIEYKLNISKYCKLKNIEIIFACENV